MSVAEVVGIDHIYLSVSDLARAETFYDLVLLLMLGFRKNRFEINGDAHIQYYNRHFGYVLRPAHGEQLHDAYSTGLHHLCLRVPAPKDVQAVSQALQMAGVEVSAARCYPEYAPDYWACYFKDPDGIRLEITNYRQERRERHDNWEHVSD